MLSVLRSSFRERASASNMPTTAQSMAYRRRAARLARLSEAATEELEQLKLIQQALSWIQLAENDELIAVIDDRG